MPVMLLVLDSGKRLSITKEKGQHWNLDWCTALATFWCATWIYLTDVLDRYNEDFYRVESLSIVLIEKGCQMLNVDVWLSLPAITTGTR